MGNEKLVIRTQSAQHSHNKTFGCPDTYEIWSIQTLLNSGNSHLREGGFYNWSSWARFRNQISATWNWNLSSLNIECNMSAGKWSNGLYYRFELQNYITVIRVKSSW